MNVKGVIFDFDGTLFDTMSIWLTAGSDYLTALGYEPEQDLGKKLSPMSLQQSSEYLKEAYALPFSVEEVMEGINKTVENFYFYRAEPKEDIIPFLKALQRAGVKMCIATATDHYQIEAALGRHDMLEFFSDIVTCSEVGHGKDEPHVFEAALEAIHTEKSETIVFEDAYHAAKTAKDAGFYVVGVSDAYEPRTDELKHFTDAYVSNFSEAEKLLLI